MSKGIVYLMLTSINGLIKIGKTDTKNFESRMRFLETNGYANATGLKRYFAIELEDYADKEKLLHENFKAQRAGLTELFVADVEIAEQLLLSFNGKVIFPKNTNQAKAFAQAARQRKQGQRFNFYRKGLKNGDVISFCADPSITAKIIGEREVEYKGEPFLLSPLARKLYEQMNKGNNSHAYQGAYHFMFNGKRLTALPDKTL